MGGASVVAMTTGLIRGKLVAIVLGPAGIGMLGVLNQLVSAMTQILGFGIGSSAVKFVHSAESEDHLEREGVVYRFSIKLAIIGASIALIMAVPVCLLSFRDLDNLPAVIIVSIAVPFSIISLALGALLQGRGNVKAVAETQIWSTLAAFLMGVTLIWFGGIWGLILSIIVTSVCPLILMRKYFKLNLPVWHTALFAEKVPAPLINMGLALIATITISQLAAYFTRIIVVNELGIIHAGYYQAAFSIAGTIPSFVFSAMSTDFYPRVSAAKNENDALDITDRQIMAGIVLATPCFVGLVLFGQTLLSLFYTAEFQGALDLLRWMIWGVACRLVSWPLGYWLLARATPKQLFWLESIAAIIVMALTFLLVPWFGLMGAGIAFLAGAIIYGLMMIAFVYHKVGRSISPKGILFSGLAIVAMAMAQLVVMGQYSLWIPALTLAVVTLMSGLAYYVTIKKERHA
jgi:PST family polysaccharide transporter